MGAPPMTRWLLFGAAWRSTGARPCTSRRHRTPVRRCQLRRRPVVPDAPPRHLVALRRSARQSACMSRRSVPGYDLTNTRAARLTNRLDGSPHFLLSSDGLRAGLAGAGFVRERRRSGFRCRPPHAFQGGTVVGPGGFACVILLPFGAMATWLLEQALSMPIVRWRDLG